MRRVVIGTLLVLVTVLGVVHLQRAGVFAVAAPLPRTSGPAVQHVGAFDVVTLPLDAWDVRISWSRALGSRRGREEDLSERGPFAGIITAHPISLAPRERGEGRGEGPK